MSLTDTIDILYGNPMKVLSDCLRSFICAPPDKHLICADFANIEGRGLAWLCGDEPKLNRFRAYDRGEAPDIYIQTYASAFGVPAFDKKDPRRQTGKTMELFSGYQGAHGAYLKGIKPKDLPKIAAAVKAAVPADEWAEHEAKYNGSHGLKKDQWTAIAVLVRRWRDDHPLEVEYWRELEDAAIRAVANPGLVTHAGHPGRQIKFLKKGSFLLARLPSGRRLAYPFACLKDVEMPWRDRDGNKVYKPQVHYMTVDSVTKSWGETNTYGGKLCENVTQAVCRDILAEAIKRAEKNHYPVIMHVHDEIVSEVPESFGSVEDFEALLCETPAWAAGFPIAAEGWRGKRYRK